MAIELMAKIWARPRAELDPSEKWVLTIMADRADDDGLLWYAVATIADKTSFTDRAVQKIVDRLIAKGLVKKLHRRDRSNYYVVQMDKFPDVERKKRPKELGPKEFIAELDAEPDLFGTGERGSGTGERRSSTGERGSSTGEPSSPDSLSDSLNDSLNDPQAALAAMVMEGWNNLASEHENLPAIDVLNDTRKRSIQLRAEEYRSRFNGRVADDQPPSAEEKDRLVWEYALGAIASSKLLTGQKLDWNASFDWVIKRANFLKIMEGNYGRGTDQVGRAPAANDRSAATAGSEARRIVERARQRR